MRKPIAIGVSVVLTVTVSESQPVTYSTLNKKRSELRGRGEVRVGFILRKVNSQGDNLSCGGPIEVIPGPFES